MKVNGGDFILRRYSGGISCQNTSPVENYEDNLMLTWNPDVTISMVVLSGFIKGRVLHQKKLKFT